MRDLLNSLPEALLALVFVVLTVGLTLGALVLVRTYLPTWRTNRAVEGVIGIAAMVMTLFALVLAFVVVNLYSDYNDAVIDVTDEANSLGAMVQDARAFSPAGRLSVDRAVAQYVAEVRRREFRKLADGSTDPRAQQLIVKVVDAFQAYRPVTSTQKAFYAAAADQINTFLGERQNRLNKAETIIPPPLLILLVFLGVATIAVSLLISTGHLGIDIALITILAVVVAAGFATGLILQYPYSGSIAVSSDAFSHGSLSQLAQLGG